MKTKAIAYLRTSSAANVGADKDSEKRQRVAIAAFAKAHGYEVVDSFYDAAVSGADPVGERPGFKAMMDRIAGNGVRVIIVESPDRFARDLAVQIAGHDYLKGLGVVLVPTSAPDFFAEDTPTAVLVRQVLGAIAQFEKASLVAKMKAARDRKRAETGEKVGGRKSYSEDRPEVVKLAHKLARRRRKGQRLSLRQICAALADAGHASANGSPFTATSVQRMLAQ
jgi:DNA invertase Pin-like site-specific DNA recombinase